MSQQSTSTGRSPLVIATADLPAVGKLDAWKEVGDQFFPLEHRRFSDNFEGSLTLRDFGVVQAVDVVCDRVECARTLERIAHRSMEAYFIFEQLDAAPSCFRTAGHPDGTMNAGDMILGDADTPFESRTHSRFAHRVWLFPRPMIDAIGGFDGTLARGVHLPQATPKRRLLAAYLAEMQVQWPALSAASATDYAEVAARLLALAAGSEDRDEPARDALASGELAIVKRRIAQRLSDPLLSPGRVAQDCGISVRKLHALFSATGVTFSAFVAERRLALARQILCDPRHAARPVADIAFSVGFNSLSTFYRLFGDAYGRAPSQVRPERGGRTR